VWEIGRIERERDLSMQVGQQGHKLSILSLEEVPEQNARLRD
jgi:hypothetical protein